MKAGIDFGSTLVKAVWQSEGEYQFASTKDMELSEIALNLRAANVTQINASGIGASEERLEAFDGLNVVFPEGDPIENETRLQALGARRLLEDELDSYLLVSVGTGVSYTHVYGDETRKFPIGSALGGGFIIGVGYAAGFESIEDMKDPAFFGTTADLLIKDMFPDAQGTITGDYVIAHYGLAQPGISQQDTMATAVSVVATGVIRDILLMKQIPNQNPDEDIVFIGSTLGTFEALARRLNGYTHAFGHRAHFPLNGEYSLAMGAYHNEN